ncbi:hypothetical protein [Mycolicibacterium fluoranthenivorans]|uniref:Uncharacterized protein n=1 Tax=Mycolicibacterium fluoranthenivorans TaxID=258505 RepID=A0A7X5U437_9MYCO|nr:hypothetical protein [Mycolicibacterium fluoranthenivorans]MCV7358484.1 hypothetical protein [Mycolicibacterium fluoranthenivorans]NIH98060.1 hypothetical protein [Mycolicibacterium fluoranthenivorans]
MPELNAAAVEQYTQGRLHRDDLETLRLLPAGIAAARRYCGWHVSPVIDDDEITLDGPGGRLLTLPTLRLDELTKLTEDGIDLVLADLEISGKGMVRKRSGAYWTCRFSGLVVKMTHGFDDADDFNAAVLSWIDRSSMASVGGRPTVVGPFQYPSEAMAAGSAFSDVERSLLDKYRLEPAA